MLIKPLLLYQSFVPHVFLSFLLSLSYFLTIDSRPPGSSPLKDQQVVPRNRDSGTRGKIQTEWPPGPVEAGNKTCVNRLESPLTFLLYFSSYLKFRDSRFHASEWRLAFRQWLNVTLGSLMKVVLIDFWPLWALTEAVTLPLQGNSSPPDIQQQTEHFLHEYELDDDTLQKS